MPVSEIKQVRNPEEPSLRDALNLHTIEVGLAYNAHAIATIQAFDSAKQTVRATINYQRTYFRQGPNNENEPFLVPYPILIDCPAIVLFGGSFSLKMPIKVGDTCLILFNDRDMDKWFSSGDTNQGVATPRLHSISDGIALVGLNSLAKVIEGFEENKVVLGDGVTDLKLGEDKAGLYASDVMIEANADSNKVKLANNLTTLNTLLQDLIAQIQLITVTGVTTGGGTSGPPANAAAFTTIATQLGGLLE